MYELMIIILTHIILDIAIASMFVSDNILMKICYHVSANQTKNKFKKTWLILKFQLPFLHYVSGKII